MNEERKDFVATMMRHFRTCSFPIGTFHFRYDGTLFPIVRIDELGIHYGNQPWRMSSSDDGYRISKVNVKRSLLGKGCIIDICNSSSRRREGW